MSEEQQINSEINYKDLKPGIIPKHKITTELYISHCTKSEESNLHFHFVSQLSEVLENNHNLSNFFDDKHMKTNPFKVMNQFLDCSRNFIAICTPKYIYKVMHQTGSYPQQELASFHAFEVSEQKKRIIPILINISVKEFQQQGKGIPLINHNMIVEVPSEYTIPGKKDSIIKNTAQKIVKIHNELLKQW